MTFDYFNKPHVLLFQNHFEARLFLGRKQNIDNEFQTFAEIALSDPYTQACLKRFQLPFALAMLEKNGNLKGATLVSDLESINDAVLDDAYGSAIRVEREQKKYNILADHALDEIITPILRS